MCTYTRQLELHRHCYVHMQDTAFDVSLIKAGVQLVHETEGLTIVLYCHLRSLYTLHMPSVNLIALSIT